VVRRLTDKELEEQYKIISYYHDNYLKEQGVLLPRLKIGENYTKDALTLIYLSLGYPTTKVVSKKELTEFIRFYYPEVNDVQQARHLGAQKGFYVLSGSRGDTSIENLAPGTYKLKTLENVYPKFKNQHRMITKYDFEKIKEMYDYRCATCGSKEGEPNLNWPSSITKLQEAHMDPNKPLTVDNVIPQCEQCNRGNRNRWVYDNKGRVIGIGDPKVINLCDDEIQLSIYVILYEKFKGKNPKDL